MRLATFAALLLYLLPIGTSLGQLPIPEGLEREKPGEEQKEDTLEPEQRKQLEDLEAELDELLAGKDKLSLAINDIKEKLKQEYQDNEKQALEAAEVERSKLAQRRRLIASYVLELDRQRNSDPRRGFDGMRKVSERLREFSREHRELAKHPEFITMQTDLMKRAMINRRGGFQPGIFGGDPTLASTMQSLSAGKVDLPQDNLGPTRAHPGAQAGAIQDVQSQVRDLLKLKWEGSKLVLDRDHWSNVFAGQTADDVAAEVRNMLEAKGVQIEQNRGARFGAQFGRRSAQSNVAQLFQELRMDGGGYSRSGSGDEFDMSIRGATIRARLKVSRAEFDFSLEEEGAPGRYMRLRDSKRGLQITLIGDELIHRFRQDSEGAISVVELFEDDTLSHKADSFAELYSSEPRFVDERFFSLLDHLGILAPKSRFDPKVIARLVETLSFDTEAIEEEVEQLLGELDSERFKVRETAFNTLESGIDKYFETLHAKQADKELSGEVRARLRRLIAAGQAKPNIYAGTLVASMKLVDNVDYLDQVLDLVDGDDKTLIEERIMELSR